AGTGVAMANAVKIVKDAAQVITKTNDEHGVSYAIEKYVLN
ncbi:MAG: HAD hydrolase family protein, partial [Alkalibacterium sp.]|nr:HAD hydrolase family protein [Alkalibacterium sp.]